jgi:hypothetical protein
MSNVPTTKSDNTGINPFCTNCPDSGDAGEYATRTDFCRIFSEEMTGLYLLSFLLTADEDRAEQCFASALEDCLHEACVFGENARFWARRTVIQNAIRTVSPRSRVADIPVVLPKADNWQTMAEEFNTPIAGILALEDFDRFVYVMSVLEGYSEQECAALLRCLRQDVRTARTNALQQVANSHAQLVQAQVAVAS